MTEDITHSISPVVTVVVLTLFSLTFLLLYFLKYFSNYSYTYSLFRFRRKPTIPQSDDGGSVSYRQHQPVTLDETGDGEDDEDDDEDKPKKQLTAKQKKRLELKEERKRLKALQDEEKEEKRKLLAMKQEQIEAKRLEREKRREEEEQKKREEEEKAYQELAATFVVESEGTMAETNQYTIDDFIDYVTSKKLTNVEELSARFSLKASEVTNRLQELEDQGRLFGLLDDQGRYIHITEDESNSVLKYLMSRGKLHKQKDLVSYFNSVISLESKQDSNNVVDLEDDD